MKPISAIEKKFEEVREQMRKGDEYSMAVRNRKKQEAGGRLPGYYAPRFK